MPLEIYGDINEPIIRTFNSPVIELVCAVHLLTDVTNHQFELKWAEEMLAKFTQEELDALESIRQFPAGGIELLNFVLESGELIDIPHFINHIRQTDISDFFFFLLNEHIERSKIQKAFIDKKERLKIQEKVKWIIEEDTLMQIFDNPEETKNKTLRIFEALMKNGFNKKLEQCKDKMEEGIRYINNFIGKDQIDSILEKISGRPKKVFTGYREYCVIPSYFISPRFIRIFSGDKIYIVFDCRVTRDKKEALLEELSSILKVIDDKSRMEILRLLVYNRSYGKAISDLLGISTPTVSHHLDILKQAGFVKEEKIRNIKYFYADKERLKKVIQDINKYFFSAD